MVELTAEYFLKEVSIDDLYTSSEPDEINLEHSDGIMLIKIPNQTESASTTLGSKNTDYKTFIYQPPDVTPKPTILFLDSQSDPSASSAIKIEPKVFNFHRMCSRCPENCLVCSSFFSCSTCKSGHYFDVRSNACKACDISCTECQGPKDHHCSRCRSGAYLSSSGKCFECESSCGSCDENPFNCSTCSSQFAFINSSGYCHSNTLKSMVYIKKINSYVPCSGCTKCIVEFEPVCKFCPICKEPVAVEVNMYQINPPILQIDFGVSSLRKTTPYDYLNIRAKDSLEEFHFEVVDNIEGTIWVKIYLDQLRPVAFEAEWDFSSDDLGLEGWRLERGSSGSSQVCFGSECVAREVRMSKFAQNTDLTESTSIDLEIIIREGLIKTSVDKFFNGATIQHTLNFVPNYNKYTCKGVNCRCQDLVRADLPDRVHPVFLQIRDSFALGVPHPVHLHFVHDHPNENKESQVFHRLFLHFRASNQPRFVQHRSRLREVGGVTPSNLLNSFYNSVYSRTSNFEFPQRINLTLAVLLVFVFGLIYLFRKKLSQLIQYIRRKKAGNKKDSKKPSFWISNLQVISTNLFFLYMPENINYVVCLLKNVHDFSNVPFLVFNIFVVFLFIKIFSDFLVFYINTLVDILIKKNKKQKKKIIEKELEKKINKGDSKNSFRSDKKQNSYKSGKLGMKDSLNQSLEDISGKGDSKRLESIPSKKSNAKSLKQKNSKGSKSQNEQRNSKMTDKSQKKKEGEDFQPENFDFVDGIENLSDFEEELALNSMDNFGYVDDDDKKPSKENLSDGKVIAVKGTSNPRHPPLDQAAPGHQGHLVLPLPNQGGPDRDDLSLLQEVRLLHHPLDHLLHQHDFLRLRDQHRRGVQGGLVHLHHLQGNPLDR